MKKAIDVLSYLGTLILFWFTIEKNYMPHLFVFLIIAFGVYSYYSIMKSIKISTTIENGLRLKKMNISFYSYLILFFLLKEVILNGFDDLYFITIVILLGIVLNLESYLEKKYQKIAFYIEGHTLFYNATFPLERNIKELIAVKFRSIGNYFVLVFENQSSITIDRDKFVTSELNNFMNQILSQCSDNVKVATEAKEKLELA